MKNIDPKDVRPGMQIRVTVDRKIPDGSAIKSSITIYESTVIEAWVDGPEPVVTLANPGFNAEMMEDGKPLRVALYADSKQVDAVLVQQLDYTIDTIVRAIVLTPEDEAAKEGGQEVGPREFEPFLFIRSNYGTWNLVGTDTPTRMLRHGSIYEGDIESGQQRFDIVEIVYAPKVGA